MADPSGYTPAYSFSGFQSSSPSKPLPATSLDVELAAIAAAIDSLRLAVLDVRRSDGALPNGEVTFDALAEEVRRAIEGGGENDGVTTNELDPSVWATAEQAAAGVASDKIMTPQRVTQAMDAKRAFASQGEAAAAAVADKVLSPASGKQLLDAIRAYATQGEAEAGVEETHVMTPLRVAQAIAKIQKILNATQAMTWAEIAAGASQTQTVTVTGAQVGDPVVIGYPGSGVEDGILPTAWVSADHTVSVRFRNTTAAPVTPAAASLKFKVMRF